MTGVQTCALPICFPVTIQAKILAKGTPRVKEIKAANVEVQIESLIASKSENELKNLLHGVLLNRAIKGDTIINAASAPSILVINPNFIGVKILY